MAKCGKLLSGGKLVAMRGLQWHRWGVWEEGGPQASAGSLFDSSFVEPWVRVCLSWDVTRLRELLQCERRDSIEIPTLQLLP